MIFLYYYLPVIFADHFITSFFYSCMQTNNCVCELSNLRTILEVKQLMHYPDVSCLIHTLLCLNVI